MKQTLHRFRQALWLTTNHSYLRRQSWFSTFCLPDFIPFSSGVIPLLSNWLETVHNDWLVANQSMWLQQIVETQIRQILVSNLIDYLQLIPLMHKLILYVFFSGCFILVFSSVICLFIWQYLNLFRWFSFEAL